VWVCVCVCVWEREREREWVSICICLWKVCRQMLIFAKGCSCSEQRQHIWDGEVTSRMKKLLAIIEVINNTLVPTPHPSPHWQ
jgi:hypothetical protein